MKGFNEEFVEKLNKEGANVSLEEIEKAGVDAVADMNKHLRDKYPSSKDVEGDPLETKDAA